MHVSVFVEHPCPRFQCWTLLRDQGRLKKHYVVVDSNYSRKKKTNCGSTRESDHPCTNISVGQPIKLESSLPSRVITVHGGEQAGRRSTDDLTKEESRSCKVITEYKNCRQVWKHSKGFKGHPTSRQILKYCVLDTLKISTEHKW